VTLLADFPLSEGGAGVRSELDNVRVELSADAEGLDEEEVARDEGVLEAELLVRCHATSTHLPAIVDVVVDERRGVDEFQGGGQIDRLSDVFTTKGLESEEGHRGPDAFATCGDNVGRNVREERLFGNHTLPDLLFHHGQFLGHAKIPGVGHTGGHPTFGLQARLW